MPNDLLYDDIIKDKHLSAESLDLYKKHYPVLATRQFSDITDNSGNQYVNLVQQGGGVWGVALTGFVYALEAFGIRFMRLAGTSAGAINTILLAAVDERHQSKSWKIRDILFSWDFSSFMDGGFSHRWANTLVQAGKKAKYIAYFMIASLVATLCYPLLSIIRNEFSTRYYPALFLPGFLLVILLALYYFILKKAQFGINKGDAFLAQLSTVLRKEGIYTVSDLNKKYNKVGGELNVVHRLKSSNDYNNYVAAILDKIKEEYSGTKAISVAELDKLKSELTARNKINDGGKPFSKLRSDYNLITTDILSKIKVELPKMANMYWCEEDLNTNTSPASFVRASMSVPLFFKPYTIYTKPQFKEVELAWKYWLNTDGDKIPKAGVFIDGGSISNFPIDIFHERDVIGPRLPVFGVRLFESEPPEGKKRSFFGRMFGWLTNWIKMRSKKKNLSPEASLKAEINERIFSRFSKFGGHIIDTIRGYNDKNFLTKYSFYNKYSVAYIDCRPSNWLNFKMRSKEMEELFNKGFQAGINFLLGFDWENYKYDRVKLALKERNILKDESVAVG